MDCIVDWNGCDCGLEWKGVWNALGCRLAKTVYMIVLFMTTDDIPVVGYVTGMNNLLLAWYTRQKLGRARGDMNGSKKKGGSHARCRGNMCRMCETKKVVAMLDVEETCVEWVKDNAPGMTISGHCMQEAS